jgi:hypothetical protein
VVVEDGLQDRPRDHAPRAAGCPAGGGSHGERRREMVIGFCGVSGCGGGEHTGRMERGRRK